MASPKTEICALRSKKTYVSVFTSTAISIEIAEYCGLPCAVRQAESVCTHESVNALTERARTSPISVCVSSSFRLLKIILTAGEAKKYKASALTVPSSAVKPNAKKIRFLRAFLVVACAILGTLETAMP